MLGKHSLLSLQHPVETDLLEITQIYVVKVRLHSRFPDSKYRLMSSHSGQLHLWGEPPRVPSGSGFHVSKLGDFLSETMDQILHLGTTLGVFICIKANIFLGFCWFDRKGKEGIYVCLKSEKLSETCLQKKYFSKAHVAF